MDSAQTIQSFLATQSVAISIVGFLINLVLAAISASMISAVYVRFGTALSNRRMFARNLTFLTLTTTLVITIVKSSLALSLGLVGALSIVRFRAAIKEPEELTYLFLAIGIGLGFGANQRAITLVAMLVIMLFVILRSLIKKSDENQNLLLTVSSDNPENVTLSDLIAVLRNHTRKLDMKRFDQTNEVIEASFLVEFDGFQQLEESRLAVEALGDSVSITFVDNKGLS